MDPQDVKRAANMVKRIDELNGRIKYLDQLVRILASGRHKSILKMDITCLETKEQREYDEARKQAGESEIEKYNREVMEIHLRNNPHLKAAKQEEQGAKPEDHVLELKLSDVMGIQVMAVILDCYLMEKRHLTDTLKSMGINYENSN